MTEVAEKIILVEDDLSVRTTIVTFLELEGFEVEAYSNSRGAIERLSRGGCPLVISDIYIDDRTGLDVLNAAKKQDCSCAVILMTARGTIETVMAATRNGCFEYLAKPFELDTLLEAVKRAIAARTPEDDEVEAEDLPESEMMAAPRAWSKSTRPWRRWRRRMRPSSSSAKPVQAKSSSPA